MIDPTLDFAHAGELIRKAQEAALILQNDGTDSGAASALLIIELAQALAHTLDSIRTRTPSAETLNDLLAAAETGLDEMRTWEAMRDCNCQPPPHTCDLDRLRESIRQVEKAVAPAKQRRPPTQP